MNFLFWNLNKKELKTEIVELCEIHDIDVLILAECNSEPSKISKALNEKNHRYYFANGIICQKIKIFSRFEESNIAPIEENERTTARKLISPKYGEIIFIATHFQSQLHWTSNDQAFHTQKTKLLIDRIEDIQGHKRTVICGDFNMNPFDLGIVQSSGLHAVMEKRIAQKLSRKIDGENYTFFYNPMWGFLGDSGRGSVSGTYYYSPAKPVNFHWNMFDQVLIRPDLLSDFDEDALEIITIIGEKNLLTKDNTISKHYSDHLPIKFSLKI